MASVAKLPPQNLEAEQAVLGCCILDPTAALKATEVLPDAGDFYRAIHQIIYDCILDLLQKGEPVDILTVTNELKRRNKFEEIGGSEFLTSLLNVMPTTTNVEYYSSIIREKAILRSLVFTGHAISDLGAKEEDRADELLDRAESLVFGIAQKRITRDFDPLKDILKRTYDRISELHSRKAHVTGIPTYFDDLDHITAGLQNSDLIILAARPGMGKTALAMNIAMNVAIRDNLPVAIFNLEMSKEQLSLRLLCSNAKIDSNRLRTGFLGENDWPKLTNSMNELTNAPIYIDDTPNLSVLEMHSKTRRLQKNYGLKLLIVDYIQLIRGSSKTENRSLELSEITRQLKALSKELNIPVLCLSQLSRKVEERVDKRPLLSDLRESGAIEQDADLVIFIYRDAYYRRKGKEQPGEKKDDNTAEIIIAKHRNGPTGTVKLGFLGQYTLFVPLENEY
ncbi:MAG: replicative DNA helicase [Candidatus Eremiobacteraeota bacterium]|nr:replicative DNA helicase [Candidatus Eremiobacteraeota bacterium]